MSIENAPIGTRCAYCGIFDAAPDKVHCGLVDRPAHPACIEQVMVMLVDMKIPPIVWRETLRKLVVVKEQGSKA